MISCLHTLINGPKIKPQEQAAINDPKTNVLITDEEKIKEVSLAHNVEILTKMKPLPQYEYLVKEKQEGHNEMMRRNLDEDNWSLDINFYRKVIKRIKDKNKNMFKLFNKSGATYKAAVFTIMKRFIEQAGAELGQAQVKLDDIVVIVVEVLVKAMVEVEVQLLFRLGGWVIG